MKNRIKRLTALLLAMAMSLCLLSANVWATEEPPRVDELSAQSSEEETTAETQAEDEPELTTQSAPEVSADATEEENTTEEAEPSLSLQGVLASGTMKGNSNVTYTLSDDGTLVFEGTGPIPDDDALHAPTEEELAYGVNYSYNTYLEDTAFLQEYKERIRKVIINSGITYVGAGIFWGCSNLETVSIPETVTGIGRYAFRGTRSVKDLTIPSQLTKLGDHAFWGCGIGGVLTIPSGITRIPGHAFADCANIEEIVLHDKIVSIGQSAFAGSSIQTIVIPDSVTEIGNGVFKDCKSLMSVTIGGGITAIPDHFFECNTHLMDVTIREGITSIGKSAFYGDTTLYKVELPDSLTVIDNSAFGGCTTLSRVQFGKNLKTIGERAFYQTAITRADLPQGVESIGELAFAGCKSLTAAIIPDSVTTLGKETFEQCSNLETCSIGSGLTYLPKNIFNHSGLKSIELGSNVQRIDEDAFIWCENLTQITLSDGLTSIGNGAFQYCRKLEEIVIPDSVTSIDQSAFSYCDSLKKVKLSNSLSTLSRFLFSHSGIVELDIPESVKKIEEDAFYECQQLERVSFPTELRTIEGSAFYHCSALKEAILPDLLSNIPRSAFSGCKNLSVVRFPKKLKTIDGYAFYETALKELQFDCELVKIGENAFYGCGNLETIVFPPTLTSILDGTYYSLVHGAFQECKSLKSVTFTGDAPVIGNAAFKGLTLYAFYPANNTTWTDSVKKNYGGTVTWSVICDPHTPGTAVKENAVNPTCEKKGSYDSVVYCTKCGLELSREHTEQDATGHQWDQGKISTAATCKSEGTMVYTCTVCRNTERKPIAIDPQNHTGGTEVRNKKEATATKDGYTGDTYCKGCGARIAEGEVIPATDGHVWDDGTITRPATCVDKGVKTFKCTECEETRTVEIPVNPDNHTGGVEVRNRKSATRTEDGYTGDTYCKGCGEILIEGMVIPASGGSTSKEENSISASNVVRSFSTKKQTVNLSVSVYDDAELSFSSSNKKVSVNSDGKVTIAAKFSGTATITITAAETDEYNETEKTITVTVPTVTKVSKVSAGKGQMTVQWKKNATGKGYEVQYSKKKNFSASKTAKIKKRSVLKTTIKAKKGTWYVRIRTVNGKYCSNWSTVKTAKIK